MIERSASVCKRESNDANDANSRHAAGRTAGAQRRGPHRLRSGLGTNDQICTQKIEVVCPETGVVTGFARFPGRDEYELIKGIAEIRLARFALQSVARKILFKHMHPRGASSSWRVTQCMRRLAGSDVRVLKSLEYGSCHYGNLRVCGSVWTCPVCAAKISQFRKSEIEVAGETHKQAGGHMYMVTLTFSHSRQDKLKDLIGDSKRNSGLRAALRRLRNSRGYKSLAKEIGLVGVIRNLEVTVGQHGWHPHVHELWLVSEKQSVHGLQAMLNALFAQWEAACLKSGLARPNRKRGVHIVEALTPAEYLQKWGREQRWTIGSELAKSHIKNGAGIKSRTPFDLLCSVAEGEEVERSQALFREYASAFFGQRQCFWTVGLKEAFGLAERSDEEIAEAQEDRAVEVCSISLERWRLLLAQPYEARSLVLSLAETGGSESVDVFLSSLK